MPWIRWLLVIPGAVAAYFAVSIAVGILSEVDPFWGNRSEGVRNFVSQLANSIVAPISFVYAGSRVAPTHRFIVSVVLASVFGCMTIAVAGWLLVYHKVEGTFISEGHVLGTWWLVVSGAISLIAAGATCTRFYHKEDMALPEIGRHIEWADIIRQVFRVLEFDRCETRIGPDDSVEARSRYEPYGYLLVESPILNEPARLPIVHCGDFLLAASVFDEPRSLEALEGEEVELLVTYVPKHKLPQGLVGVIHGLHYVLTPRGTLERYYEVGNGMHMASPLPEKLFGPFVWVGEMRVKGNAHPVLGQDNDT